MSNAYDELRLLAAELYDTESRGGISCPFCRGGRTGERTLSITRLPTGEALYKCHRAKCDRAGRIGGTFGVHDKPRQTPKPEFEPRFHDARGDVDVRAYDAVGNDYYQSPQGWLNRFGIEASGEHCRWNPGSQRTVWEVRGPLGTLRGYELRAYRDDHQPKTLHYRHSPEPWVGWFSPPGPDRTFTFNRGRIVVVEDVVSATKVAMAGIRSASLMGTHLNLEKLLDLLSVTDNIVLALDRDATAKANGYCQRYALLAPCMRALPLDRDLKYEDTTTIRRMVRDTTNGDERDGSDLEEVGDQHTGGD